MQRFADDWIKAVDAMHRLAGGEIPLLVATSRILSAGSTLHIRWERWFMSQKMTEREFDNKLAKIAADTDITVPVAKSTKINKPKIKKGDNKVSTVNFKQSSKRFFTTVLPWLVLLSLFAAFIGYTVGHENGVNDQKAIAQEVSIAIASKPNQK